MATTTRDAQQEQRLFPVNQAARMLGLTETALRTQIFRGRINVVRLGGRTLIHRDELDRVCGLSA